MQRIRKRSEQATRARRGFALSRSRRDRPRIPARTGTPPHAQRAPDGGEELERALLGRDRGPHAAHGAEHAFPPRGRWVGGRPCRTRRVEEAGDQLVRAADDATPSGRGRPGTRRPPPSD